MAVRTNEIFNQYMPPTRFKSNSARWLAVLFISVFLLVLILLRGIDRHSANDLNDELIDQFNRESSKTRWSIDKAQSWYAEQPWFLGANYLPSTSVNVLEMWQTETFDIETIKRELSWANRRLKMNVLRVFLHIFVWKEDKQLFFQRLDTFLRVASENNLRIMFVLFDECWNADPKPGKQPEPIKGVHNSQWVRCPGQTMLLDKSTWPLMARYTMDVIDRYKSDDRVFAWDLYNEPECSKQLKIVLPFLRYIYSSARLVANVKQPITIGIAKWPLTTPLASFELSVSDIISFHSYGPLANLISNVTDLRKIHPNRPILCTEWLARPFGSTVFTHLEYFRSEKIGAIQWGLVAGKSQTYYQWKSPEGAPMPKIWFHDFFYKNGTAFSRFEEKFYSEL